MPDPSYTHSMTITAPGSHSSFTRVPTGLSVLRPSHPIILVKYQASNYSFTIKHFIKCVNFAPVSCKCLALPASSPWRGALRALCWVLRKPCPGAGDCLVLWSHPLRRNRWVIPFPDPSARLAGCQSWHHQKGWSLPVRLLGLGGTNEDRRGERGTESYVPPSPSPTGSAPRNTPSGQGVGDRRVNYDALTHQALSLSLRKKEIVLVYVFQIM